MKSIICRNPEWLRLVVMVLTVCLAALPPVPVMAMATEAPGSISAPSQEAGTSEVVVLNDHKKAAAGEHQEPDNTKIEKAQDPDPVSHEQKKDQPVDIAGAARENDVPTESSEPAEDEKEGLPMIAKVGIGVAAAAVVGITVGLAVGGSKESGPELPTPEMLIGRWSGRGTSYADNRTYTGVYDLYAIGSHTYDIYVTGDDVRKQGRGVWTLGTGTNTLQLENDTGSVYVGDFQNEDFTTITMTTTNGSWGLVLTRE